MAPLTEREQKQCHRGPHILTFPIPQGYVPYEGLMLHSSVEGGMLFALDSSGFGKRHYLVFGAQLRLQFMSSPLPDVVMGTSRDSGCGIRKIRESSANGRGGSFGDLSGVRCAES